MERNYKGAIMRAYNKKRKPKHMTKYKHLFTEDEIGLYHRIVQLTTKRKSTTHFWYDRKGKPHTIYKIYKLKD